MDTTTVLLKKSTKKKLDALKLNPRESIDSVVDRLTKLAIDEEPLTKEEIKGIKQSLKDIEAGRVYKAKDVYKELGI